MRIPFLASAVAALLVLASCGGGSTPPRPTPIPTVPSTVVPTQAGQATVTVKSRPPYGDFLGDRASRSLYLFVRDTKGGKTSACDAQCLRSWTPFTSIGQALAGNGVPQRLVGTITLPGGKAQVTYNGWPLYYYARDTSASDTNGEAVDDAWFLVSVDGNPIPPPILTPTPTVVR